MISMKIIWVSVLTLDSSLHKTTQIEILRSLEKRGHKTVLFAMISKHWFRTSGQSKLAGVPLLNVFPMRYVPIVSVVLYTILMTIILPIKILSFNADVVILEPDISIISSIPSLLIGKLKKTKFVLDVRSVPVEVNGFLGMLKNFWYKISLSAAKIWFSGITTITPMMKEKICTDFSIKPDKVGVWSSGVSVTLFNPDYWSSKGYKLRIKLGLVDKFVVLYHGHITENRGLVEAVEGIKILARKNSNVILFILGSGPATSKLKSIVEKENLQVNVIIHKAVEYEQVPLFISMSDVGIIPLPNYSYWKPQSPLKLLEYLAMEKVVIATDIPCHRYILGNQNCCVYIPSSSPEAIAKGIEYTLANKDKFINLGYYGRKIILEKYTWEKVAEDFEQYLMSLK